MRWNSILERERERGLGRSERKFHYWERGRERTRKKSEEIPFLKERDGGLGRSEREFY